MISSVVLVVTAVAVGSGAQPESRVGMPVQIDRLVLPGPLLEAKPLTDRQLPVVVRIKASYPHGDAYRYDIEYYVLEPGTHDLREYLQRQDGSAMDDVPPIVVEVTSALPPGQVLPNSLSPGRLPSVGGYTILLVVGGVAWVLGLVAILFVGRHRKAAGHKSAAHRVTLEERLQAAIKAAGEGELGAGELGIGERAELERMVLAYWRQRLGLGNVEAAEAMAAMRQNEQASAALDQLEHWLHHPSPRNLEDFKRLIHPTDPVPNTEQK